MTPVARWLEQIGLSRYADVFAANDIGLDVVGELTETDLEKLGVTLGDRKRILRSVRSGETSDEELPNQLPIDSPAGTDAPERRQLTTMFCDMVDSTGLSTRLELEPYRELLSTYQAACTRVIVRFDGVVSRYIGDGLLVCFGYPAAHEDDAERAVRAALGIIDELVSAQVRSQVPHGVELAVRIGIATGIVIVGDIVGEGVSEQSAILGETPNLAARLQALAQRNGIVVSATTRSLLGRQFELESLGNHTMKGFPGEIPAWRIQGSLNSSSRFDATRRGQLSPFVGRDAELRLLTSRWRLGNSGEGQVVLVSGEAGIGKSRILHELLRSVADGPHRLLRCQCSPHHVHSALHPFARELEHAAGIEQQDAKSTKVEKLTAALAGVDLAGAESLTLFGMLLDLEAAGDFHPTELDPLHRKSETFRQVQQRVQYMTRDRPLLVLFEDAHWADPSSLELLDRLVAEARTQRVLIVVTSRPGFGTRWGNYPHAGQITLNRLATADVATIIRSVGGRAMATEVASQIAWKTDGNALFVEEVTRHMLESNSLTVPSSLADSLMERLDRLGEFKEHAQAGAIVGREFSHRLAVQVAGQPEERVGVGLQRLVESGLVFRVASAGDPVYRFKHALVQEVARSSMLNDRRADLHGRIAGALERDGSHEAPEVIAHHYAEAGNAPAAVKHLRLAASRAMRRSASAEAIASLEFALAQNATRGDREQAVDEEIELREMLCIPLEARSWGSSKIGANLERLRELRQARGDGDELFSVLHGLCGTHLIGGRIAAARASIEDMRALVGRDGDPALGLLLEHESGMCAFFAGDFDVASQHFEAVVEHLVPGTASVIARYYVADAALVARCVLAWSHAMRSRTDAAQRTLSDALRLAMHHEQPFSTTYALSIGASCCQALGLSRAALRLATRAVQDSSLHGYTYWDAWARIVRGWALARLGQHAQGLEEIRTGTDRYLATGSALIVPYARALYADALYEAGEIEAGQAVLDELASAHPCPEVTFFAAPTIRIAEKLAVGLARAPNFGRPGQDTVKGNGGR